MNITLEVLNEATVAPFQRLLREYAELRNYDAAMGDIEGEINNLLTHYTAPNGAGLLALSGNEAAGCIAFRKINTSICEMKRLFVVPAFYGQHIGKTMCSELISLAKKSGYKQIRLDTHPWMIHAQKLYGELGFVEIERYNNNPTKGIRFFELTL